MDTTLTEPQTNPSDGRNDLQKVIHSFVFGGEEPSKETKNRASFVKSFLAEYYNTALCGTDYPVPESGNAHSCNTTTSCTINSPCNDSNTTDEVNICNNTYGKDDAKGTRITTTEHPNLFNSINSTDEAERLNSMRDMSSKLAVKLGSMYKDFASKGGAASSNFVKSALKLSNPVQTVSPVNKEVGDLSQHLQLFVDNINESLHMLGTTDLTEEELKLLLAAAPLPSISSTSESSDQPVRARSRSAGEVLNRTASPANLVSRRLIHSVSEGVRHVTKDTKLKLVKGAVAENEESDTVTVTQSNESNDDVKQQQSSALRSSDGVSRPSNDVMISRQRSCSVDTAENTNVVLGFQRGDGVCNEQSSAQGDLANDGTPSGTPNSKSRRSLSLFFTKKMESFTNLLDNIEFAEKDEQRVFSKAKSFNISARSGSVTPKSGCATPRSGYATPRGDLANPDNDDLNTASLKLKMELVEKALCDEVAVRTAAEQKATQLNEIICQIKTELDRTNSQKETVAAINKQMGVELRFLRQRNSRVTREYQQWEDALVGETKKRKILEGQLQMLIKSYKESNANMNISSESGELTNKQQEEVFSRQREEVLLAVIESLREQLHNADTEMEKARLDWQEERARFQETHDLLRFQLDHATLTRQSPQSGSGKDGPDISEKVSDIMKDYDSRKYRSLSRQVSVYDLRAKPNGVHAESVESKGESEKATTPMSERMKLFFLSSSWWPKFDFMNNNGSQPPRPPVLLMQIVWWISELREYATTHHISMRFLAHSNQFCNCDDCVRHITKTVS